MRTVVSILLFIAVVVFVLQSCKYGYETNAYKTNSLPIVDGKIDASLQGTSIKHDQKWHRLSIEGNPYQLFVRISRKGEAGIPPEMMQLHVRDVETGTTQSLPGQVASTVPRGHSETLFAFFYPEVSLPDVTHDVDVSGIISLKATDGSAPQNVPFDFVLKAEHSFKEKNILQVYWDGLKGI
jgi:hypothetical protein